MLGTLASTITLAAFRQEWSFSPSSPHDALKHHFTSLKTDLIFLQPRFLEWKFLWNWFTNTWQFSLIFRPHQIIFIHYKSGNCDSNSRLVLGEDDHGKFRLKRVKCICSTLKQCSQYLDETKMNAVFIQPPIKGLWACLRHSPPDIPRLPQTFTVQFISHFCELGTNMFDRLFYSNYYYLNLICR